MKEYKVLDLSYSQDPRQHLKDVAAYHELDGWRLLSVVHLQASGRWLYYLEREAAAAVTAGVDVLGGGASAEVFGPGTFWRLPPAAARPRRGPTEAPDAGSLLRSWRACMREPRPSDWEQLVATLLEDTDAALEALAASAQGAGPS